MLMSRVTTAICPPIGGMPPASLAKCGAALIVLGGGVAIAAAALRRDGESAPAPGSNDEVDHATRMVRDMFGSAAQVDVQLGDSDMLIGIRVKQDIGVKATIPQWRERVERDLTTRLAGSWRARWDLEADTVEFFLRPKMPTFLTAPDPVADPAAPDFNRVLVGRNEAATAIHWGLNLSQHTNAWSPERPASSQGLPGPGPGKTNFK